MAMNTSGVVNGGICGLETRIQANSDHEQNVTFALASGCEEARGSVRPGRGRGFAEGRDDHDPYG